MTTRGRRAGTSRTREAIAEAARRSFGELGYERTTIRAIANEAGVDPALVIHFYGSKQQLFLSVIDLPFAPEEVLPAILAGDRNGVGERFARFVVGMLEDENARSVMTGMVRAASTEAEAAAMLRELISRRVFAAIADGLGVDDANLRANLVGTQVVGLVLARYVVAVEPLASLDADRVVASIAPTFQRYLVGPLTEPDQA
ncbi:MAG TPA: TetR family transcriptional regulator [Gaiellaceae bacterium]|nr:TetR family transcriptional regulator [Gaiellaceae bacterium]